MPPVPGQTDLAGQDIVTRMMVATLHAYLIQSRVVGPYILPCGVTSVDAHFLHAVRHPTTSFLAGRLAIHTRVSGRDQSICRVVGHNASVVSDMTYCVLCRAVKLPVTLEDYRKTLSLEDDVWNKVYVFHFENLYPTHCLCSLETV